ncbi:MAG: 6-carboxytetrahydropterin synthase QueD [Clostridium sp.]|nr:6-carboxytetrahydropterin synthase QueD [Clostridium sp.]
MFKLKSEIQFDMAHYLSGYEGKCSNIHGHRYKVIATLKGEKLQDEGQQRGMLIDFGDFKKELKEIAQIFDHKLVIEKNEEGIKLKNELKNFDVLLVDYRPTAEEMSRHIYKMLKDKHLPIYEVEVYETPNNSCTYMEEE